MQIGELAKKAEVPAKTIRYYEGIGLLPEAPRTEGGYRRYSLKTVELLQFIRKAQGLGLTLSEIKDLAEIRSSGSLPCIHLHALLQEKMKDLEERIREMTNLRDEMRKTLRNWNRQMKKGNVAVICPHIEMRPDEIGLTKVSLKTQKGGKRKTPGEYIPSGRRENS